MAIPQVVDALVRRQLSRMPPSLGTCSEFVEFVNDRMLSSNDVTHKLTWLVDIVKLLFSWRTGVTTSSGPLSSATATPVQTSASTASSASTFPGLVLPSAVEAGGGVAASVVGDVNPGLQGRVFLVALFRLLARVVVALGQCSGDGHGGGDVPLLLPLPLDVLATLPRLSFPSDAPPSAASALADTPLTVARFVIGFLLEHCLFAVDVSARGQGALCRGSDERAAGFHAFRVVIEQVGEVKAHAGGSADGALGTPAVTQFHLATALIRDALASLCEFAKGSAAALPAGYEWTYSTSEEGKGDAGFVGLRNFGSTCYVNSAVQQLFMSPTLCRGILSANPLVPSHIAAPVLASLCSEPSAVGDAAAAAVPPPPPSTAALSAKEVEEHKERALLLHLQLTFVWLKYGAVRSFEPSAFVQACDCLGLEFPVMHQNDAAEFVDKLVACIEKRVKGTPQESVLQQVFGGKQVTQSIRSCCSDRYVLARPYLKDCVHGWVLPCLPRFRCVLVVTIGPL
jgi:hypothetical protein